MKIGKSLHKQNILWITLQGWASDKPWKHIIQFCWLLTRQSYNFEGNSFCEHPQNPWNLHILGICHPMVAGNVLETFCFKTASLDFDTLKTKQSDYWFWGLCLPDPLLQRSTTGFSPLPQKIPQIEVNLPHWL